MSTPDYFCKGRPAHPLRHLLESDSARCILCKAACEDKCNQCCPNLYLRCFFLCYSYPITVLLSCCTQRWHRTGLLFICIHPPSLQPSGLPGPVLLCPRSVSLSLMSSLLPSPPLFAAAFFWSLSPLLVKEWHGQKREEGEDAKMSNSCWYCRIIASQSFWGACFWFCCIFWGALVGDGRAWSQTQR